MAETLVFDGKVQATDPHVTLEVNPSSELGVDATPQAKPTLVTTPSPVQESAPFASAPAPEVAPAAASSAVASAAPVQSAAQPAYGSCSQTQQPEYAPVYGNQNPQANFNGQYAAPGYGAPSYGAPGAAPAGYAPYPSAPAEQLYMYPEAIYPMTKKDRNLRMAAFIFNLLTTVSVGWALIPLAWMIPITVISWRVYKGTRQSTVLFSIMTLLFNNIVSGILLLIADNN